MTGPTLRVSRLHYPVTALGFGRRLGIWTQGCPLACSGCMAQETWDPAGGFELTTAALVDHWRAAASDGAEGITISGGEPLTQPAALTDLLSALHRERASTDSEIDILLYTGYDEHELDPQQRAAADLADVVVTGRYQAGAATTLIWRGSANQIMHLQSRLGRRRYGPFLDHHPARAPIQLFAAPDGAVRIIGVPRPGGLRALEKGYRDAGLPVIATTWRRNRPL
jgi:anaerobic ribonucleoside-triphosphate reductase activating protein